MGLPVSVLDLVGMRMGESAGGAIARSVDLAQHAEEWGYRRFWLASLLPQVYSSVRVCPRHSPGPLFSPVPRCASDTTLTTETCELRPDNLPSGSRLRQAVQ